MNICSNCGEIFEEPAERKEAHYEIGGIYEIFLVCPACGSDDYAEAFRCLKCGAYIPEQQSKFNMCPSCEEDVRKRLREFLADMTDDEKELIIWEGIK